MSTPKLLQRWHAFEHSHAVAAGAHFSEHSRTVTRGGDAGARTQHADSATKTHMHVAARAHTPAGRYTSGGTCLPLRLQS